MLLLIVYLLLALVISFLCSIMESVLLSTPTSFLLVKQNEEHKWAFTFAELKENIDKPLSAILSLNTVAHTVGAAGVGAQAVQVFGEEYFGWISAILTILILVITEIIPKTAGARFWRSLAKPVTYVIRITVVISYPLVIVSSWITKIISSKEEHQTTNREEIAALTSIGTDEGIFDDKEGKIIQNLLRLKDVKVKEILTPRVVVLEADENITLSEFMEKKEYLQFSRIPVYSDNDENITGYVMRQDVYEKLADDQHELSLKELKRAIVVAPNTIPLYSMWEKLLSSKEHIALIVDEYGGMDGIVTMEDIIETLLGLEIMDEKDTISDMQEYARQRWKARQSKYDMLLKNTGKS